MGKPNFVPLLPPVHADIPSLQLQVARAAAALPA